MHDTLRALVMVTGATTTAIVSTNVLAMLVMVLVTVTAMIVMYQLSRA